MPYCTFIILTSLSGLSQARNFIQLRPGELAGSPTRMLSMSRDAYWLVTFLMNLAVSTSLSQYYGFPTSAGYSKLILVSMSRNCDSMSFKGLSPAQMLDLFKMLSQTVDGNPDTLPRNLFEVKDFGYSFNFHR